MPFASWRFKAVWFQSWKEKTRQNETLAVFSVASLPKHCKIFKKIILEETEAEIFYIESDFGKILSQICHWIFLEISCFSNMRISSIVFKLFIFYYLTSRRSIGKVTPTWPIRRTRQFPWRRCLRFRKLHQRFPRCWKPWIA